MGFIHGNTEKHTLTYNFMPYIVFDCLQVNTIYRQLSATTVLFLKKLWTLNCIKITAKQWSIKIHKTKIIRTKYHFQNSSAKTSCKTGRVTCAAHSAPHVNTAAVALSSLFILDTKGVCEIQRQGEGAWRAVSSPTTSFDVCHFNCGGLGTPRASYADHPLSHEQVENRFLGTARHAVSTQGWRLWIKHVCVQNLTTSSQRAFILSSEVTESRVCSATADRKQCDKPFDSWHTPLVPARKI